MTGEGLSPYTNPREGPNGASIWEMLALSLFLLVASHLFSEVSLLLSSHLPLEAENLAGSGFSLLITYHLEKGPSPPMSPLEVRFRSLDLTRKPEGGFYNWLNVSHRRKKREEAAGRQER